MIVGPNNDVYFLPFVQQLRTDVTNGLLMGETFKAVEAKLLSSAEEPAQAPEAIEDESLSLSESLQCLDSLLIDGQISSHNYLEIKALLFRGRTARALEVDSGKEVNSPSVQPPEPVLSAVSQQPPIPADKSSSAIAENSIFFLTSKNTLLRANIPGASIHGLKVEQRELEDQSTDVFKIMMSYLVTDDIVACASVCQLWRMQSLLPLARACQRDSRFAELVPFPESKSVLTTAQLQKFHTLLAQVFRYKSDPNPPFRTLEFHLAPFAALNLTTDSVGSVEAGMPMHQWSLEQMASTSETPTSLTSNNVNVRRCWRSNRVSESDHHNCASTKVALVLNRTSDVLMCFDVSASGVGSTASCLWASPCQRYAVDWAVGVCVVWDSITSRQLRVFALSLGLQSLSRTFLDSATLSNPSLPSNNSVPIPTKIAAYLMATVGLDKAPEPLRKIYPNPPESVAIVVLPCARFGTNSRTPPAFVLSASLSLTPNTSTRYMSPGSVGRPGIERNTNIKNSIHTRESCVGVALGLAEGAIHVWVPSVHQASLHDTAVSQPQEEVLSAPESLTDLFGPPTGQIGTNSISSSSIISSKSVSSSQQWFMNLLPTAGKKAELQAGPGISTVQSGSFLPPIFSFWASVLQPFEAAAPTLSDQTTKEHGGKENDCKQICGRENGDVALEARGTLVETQFLASCVTFFQHPLKLATVQVLSTVSGKSMVLELNADVAFFTVTRLEVGVWDRLFPDNSGHKKAENSSRKPPGGHPPGPQPATSTSTSHNPNSSSPMVSTRPLSGKTSGSEVKLSTSSTPAVTPSSTKRMVGSACLQPPMTRAKSPSTALAPPKSSPSTVMGEAFAVVALLRDGRVAAWAFEPDTLHVHGLRWVDPPPIPNSRAARLLDGNANAVTLVESHRQVSSDARKPHGNCNKVTYFLEPDSSFMCLDLASLRIKALHLGSAPNLTILEGGESYVAGGCLRLLARPEPPLLQLDSVLNRVGRFPGLQFTRSYRPHHFTTLSTQNSVNSASTSSAEYVVIGDPPQGYGGVLLRMHAFGHSVKGSVFTQATIAHFAAHNPPGTCVVVMDSYHVERRATSASRAGFEEVWEHGIAILLNVSLKGLVKLVFPTPSFFPPKPTSVTAVPRISGDSKSATVPTGYISGDNSPALPRSNNTISVAGSGSGSERLPGEKDGKVVWLTLGQFLGCARPLKQPEFRERSPTLAFSEIHRKGFVDLTVYDNGESEAPVSVSLAAFQSVTAYVICIKYMMTEMILLVLNTII